MTFELIRPEGLPRDGSTAQDRKGSFRERVKKPRVPEQSTQALVSIQNKETGREKENVFWAKTHNGGQMP